MFYSIASVYLVLKLVLFYSLVSAQAKFDYLQERWRLLTVIYTAGVGFLSFAFIFSWTTVPWPWFVQRIAATLSFSPRVTVTPFMVWLGLTFLLSGLYFWIMSKLELSMKFVIMLVLGLLLVWF